MKKNNAQIPVTDLGTLVTAIQQVNDLRLKRWVLVRRCSLKICRHGLQNWLNQKAAFKELI